MSSEALLCTVHLRAEFQDIFKEASAKLSMDGKSRAIDNVYMERFWRTIKYEEVYLKDYETMEDAKREIGKFIRNCNEQRPHSSINGLTPVMFYGNIKQQQDEQELKPVYPSKTDSVAV